MGILIAIDGVDASGKETQTKLLCAALEKQGKRVRRLSFPAYEEPSSTLVKMYLSGEFGADPGAVNPYAASCFYAADRFATFQKDWKNDYVREDTIIVTDRYVSSNIIYQAGKISDPEEKAQFIDWLCDLEFQKFAIPEPDITIFLDMPPECAARLMANRANKITGEAEKDIHEKDSEYLKKSYNNAVAVADRFGWHRVSCAVEGVIQTVDEIHAQVLSAVKTVL